MQNIMLFIIEKLLMDTQKDIYALISGYDGIQKVLYITF